MSEDSQQVGLDEIIEQNDKSDVSVNLHPHIRQLGIEVPDGWVAVSLGEIGQLDTSSVDKKSNSGEKRINLVNYMDVYENHRINSNIDYMEVTAPDSHIERSQVRLGDILFTPSSEEPRDIGNSAVVTEEMERTLHSYHTVRLRPTSDSIQLDTGFSGWLANAPYVAKQFARRATGSTRYTLTLGDFSDTQVLIPPLPEQRKIATVLYTIDRAIEKTDEIIEQTKRIKSGLLQSLLTEGYYEHNEWRTVDSQDAYLMSRGSKLPAEWEIYESDEITKIKMGHTPNTSVEEYWNGDIPWIDIHDMTKLDGTKIHTTDDSITKQGLENSGAKLLPKGTVVLCRTGDIGRSAVLGKTMTTHQQLVSFECDETKLRPHYLMYVFRYASSQLKRFSVGSTHKQIQLHFFSDLKIPLPDIDEQDKIVGVLKQVDKSIEVQKKKINQLQEVKKGLMQDLLSGTVRTTDTNIEVPEEIAQYG
jgi:type I restriction enzyme S subunit